MVVGRSGDPVILGLNAASAALTVSNIPFEGPVGAVRVGLVDGQIVINPDRDVMRRSQLDMIMTGTKEDRVVMIEMDGQQIEEEKILECFDEGFKSIRTLLNGMEQLRKEAGKEKKEFTPFTLNPKIEKDVAVVAESKLYYIFTDSRHDKISRDEAVRECMEDVFRSVEQSPQTSAAFSRLSKRIFRSIVTDTQIRCDGRSLTEFRPISSEVNLFNNLHGSAIFQRGQTQVAGTLTFDSPSAAFVPDSVSQLLGAQRKKMFMLHYEFPGFATNEMSVGRGVNRRELGHGMLAEKALRHVIPEEFPFSLRLACQVLESNGSSSMASACVGSLALMDAGVKIKNPVAGVAVGLVNDQEQDKYTLMTDILGIEDYLGDMDFKIAGSKDGFTAMQLDLKIKGLPKSVISDALKRGKDGINHVLGKMRETIAESRPAFKDSVPVIEKIDVNGFQRAVLFRSAGFNVKLIEAETGVKVEHEDDKKVALVAPNKEELEKAKEMIKKIVQDSSEIELDFGSIVTAKIVEVLERGIRVCVKEGTAPIYMPNSQLDARKVAHASALGMKVDDTIRAQYLGRDPTTGQHRLSRRSTKRPM
ncbi:hypothetical protein L596_019500 [Steinernema carpocapsae]|uniref:polyribonucleotide nucleotidyltransferase n=1 Tax=Steinernema carpocapsae TaxID=34508 RepID=A0A4U5MR74_STECR|nr:hypothetical protein L596_019500 [Steinernema carpocapsae]